MRPSNPSPRPSRARRSTRGWAIAVLGAVAIVAFTFVAFTFVDPGAALVPPGAVATRARTPASSLVLRGERFGARVARSAAYDGSVIERSDGTPDDRAGGRAAVDPRAPGRACLAWARASRLAPPVAAQPAGTDQRPGAPAGRLPQTRAPPGSDVSS